VDRRPGRAEIVWYVVASHLVARRPLADGEVEDRWARAVRMHPSNGGRNVIGATPPAATPPSGIDPEGGATGVPADRRIWN
jgi:hypothetical protein